MVKRTATLGLLTMDNFIWKILLGSNKKNLEKVQFTFNRGLLCSFVFRNKTSSTTIYNMSKELFIILYLL